MKKMMFVLVILLFLLTLTVFLQSLFREDTSKELYYTLAKNYSFHPLCDETMSIEIYSTSDHSWIGFSSKNQYRLKDERLEVVLTDVEVLKEKAPDHQTRYEFVFSLVDLGQDVEMEEGVFQITNEKFQLELPIGSVAIYQKDFPKLNFSSLYGNYAKVEEEFHLVGLTIGLDQYRQIEELRFGCGFGNLAQIRKDAFYPSEMSQVPMDLSPWEKAASSLPFVLSKGNHEYYIPLFYSQKCLTTDATILLKMDGKTYLLEHFFFVIPAFSLKDYPQMRRMGTIRYA